MAEGNWRGWLVRAMAIVSLGCGLLMPAGSFAAEPEILVWEAGKSAEKVPSWVRSISLTGGSVGDRWEIPAESAVGYGRMDIDLASGARVNALAVTLSYEPAPGMDLAMQLYNAAGELVAVDLFGNMADTAEACRTDTFIVPLNRYPSATRVSVRRIQGPVKITGLVAFPVVEAAEELPLADREELARILGERLAPSPGNTAKTSSDSLTVRQVVNADETRDFLEDPSYPQRQWRESLPAAAAFKAFVSGTCYRFFTNLYLPLFSNPPEAEKILFTSSDSSVGAALAGEVPVALSSYPPSEEQRAEFLKARGFPLLYVPVALDAVEVLVHPGNRDETLSFESLTQIFSEDGHGRYWKRAESGLSGPIITAGGSPSWGTSRFFVERVMNGAKLREDLAHLDVAFPQGVEGFVSSNQNAIGFAQHRPRIHAVKVLALAGLGGGAPVRPDVRTVSSGEYPLARQLYLLLPYRSPEEIPAPVKHFADLLLSAEGQKQVAEAGSFALSAAAVRESRRQLGLR